MEILQENDLKKKEILKELLKKANIYTKNVNIQDVRGYGGEVYILETDAGDFVVKLYKDFSPYDTIPYYSRTRVATDVDVYNKIKEIDPEIVPNVLFWDKATGVLITERVESFYELFEDVVKDNKDIDLGLYKNFAEFLYKKTKFVEPSLENPFYSVEDTKHLRSLFVSETYKNRIDEIFEIGKTVKDSLNLAGVSPKNMFVSKDKFKLIDFEEAFIGDFTYDPGFFIGHMLIYYKLNGNNEVITGLKIFAKTFCELANLNEKEKNQMISYAGLMILHRSGGFNLKGSFGGKQKELIIFGEQLLHGKDVLGLLN